MRRLAAFALMGSLALLGAALAETNSPTATDRTKDKVVSGDFTPDRVKSDQETDAGKQSNPLPRGRRYYFLWGTISPAEFEALGRNSPFLISVWTQKAEELPVKRIFVRADGRDTPLYKVSSWKTSVDANSVTAKIYGANREDGFYLVPGGAMLRKGTIMIELSRGIADWVLLELPSNVATAKADRFPKVDPSPGAKPDLKTLQAIIQRKFTGFPVPQSLP
jgi:hypothetical protein